VKACDMRIPYRSPTLTVYGDVRQLTRQDGNMTGASDTFLKFTGGAMNPMCQVDAKSGINLGGDDVCP